MAYQVTYHHLFKGSDKLKGSYQFIYMNQFGARLLLSARCCWWNTLHWIWCLRRRVKWLRCCCYGHSLLLPVSDAALGVWPALIGSELIHGRSSHMTSRTDTRRNYLIENWRSIHQSIGWNALSPRTNNRTHVAQVKITSRNTGTAKFW